MKLNRFFTLFVFLIISSIGYANDFKVIKSTPVFIPTKKGVEIKNNEKGKTIFIERIELTPQAKKIIAERINHSKENLSQKKSLLNAPSKINLGMNNVPVLDQGRHETCATFGVTAAINAVHGYDLISQLCYLELTEYLSQYTGHQNGWNGLSIPRIFNDLYMYGAVPKSYQTNYGCAGVYQYPIKDKQNTGNPISVEDYQNHSQRVMNGIRVDEIGWQAGDGYPKFVFVPKIKNALAEGHRVVIGLLLDVHQGLGGAVGSYKANQDSWILTQEIREDGQQGRIDGRHTLVVTGYDDDALITDPNNKLHQGLFKVRNSWGDVGDHGEYYMSYEYLEALIFYAAKIVPTY